MSSITDEFMRQMLTLARKYSVVILKTGPGRHQPGVERILWEHARRNFILRANGLLPIVCPVSDDSNVEGVGIFNASPDEVRKVMDEDPGVRAGVFVYEIHSCRSFPGDSLPRVATTS